MSRYYSTVEFWFNVYCAIGSWIHICISSLFSGISCSGRYGSPTDDEWKISTGFPLHSSFRQLIIESFLQTFGGLPNHIRHLPGRNANLEIDRLFEQQTQIWFRYWGLRELCPLFFRLLSIYVLHSPTSRNLSRHCCVTIWFVTRSKLWATQTPVFRVECGNNLKVKYWKWVTSSVTPQFR